MIFDVCECLWEYGISLFVGYSCYVYLLLEVCCLCCVSVYIIFISEFGFMVCKVLYCCDSCCEFFDYFKCIWGCYDNVLFFNSGKSWVGNLWCGDYYFCGVLVFVGGVLFLFWLIFDFKS